MDERSEIQLMLMAKQFPNEPIVLIDDTAYRRLKREFKTVIANWESGSWKS